MCIEPREWFCVIKVFFYSAIVLKLNHSIRFFSSVSIANINSLINGGKEALVSFDSTVKNERITKCANICYIEHLMHVYIRVLMYTPC